ncbi:endothelin-converting enzyme homolog [Zophobas morio]|uniref:endothelin-converting enzyme homolog n=1 Tax=Zophobas morio TaxID=2755281 RepID=UPI003083304F
MDLEKIEEVGITPLNDLFEEIDKISSLSDFVKFVAKSHKYGVNILFDIASEAHPENSQRTILWIYEAVFGLPSKEYYFDADKEELRSAYLSFITEILTMAGLENAHTISLEIMALETEIAKAAKSSIEGRDLKGMTNLRTLEELPSSWLWQEYFEIVGEDCLDVNALSTICVFNPTYLEFVVGLFSSDPDRLALLKHYAKWQTLLTFAPFLSSGFVDAHFRFFGQTLQGQPRPVDRWVWLIRLLNYQAGDLLGKLYCDRYFPPSSRDYVLDLAETIIVSLRDIIGKVEWMEESTKFHALEKLKNLQLKVGYPNKYTDYRAFMPSKEDNFVSIVRQLFEFNLKWDLRYVGKPTSRDRWLVAPQTVNAYYHPFSNVIVLPAGILQGYSFGPEKDLCVNYGAIGAIISHECTHGYDDQGKDVDAYGNLANWWSPNDIQKYNERLRPIIEQYSSLRVIGDHYVDGNLTLGENIADIGGVKCAYHAMQKALQRHPEANKIIDNFTPSQRFFISWCQLSREKTREAYLLHQLRTDEHPPSKVRATQTLRNIPAFYEAFQVQEGDLMFLKNESRGEIW